MSTAAERSDDNVIRLKPPVDPAEQWASQTAGEVRRRLSLLQGYADLMEGLSPAQNTRILRVMAQKIQELTKALHPFLDDSRAIPALDQYRDARRRTRELLAEYRVLLDRIHANVSETQTGVRLPKQQKSR